MDVIYQWFDQHSHLYALFILLGFLGIAVIAELLIRRIVLRFVRQTTTKLDDEIVRRFRLPLIVSIFFYGIHYAISLPALQVISSKLVDIVLITFALVLWIDSVIKLVASIANQTGTDLDDEIIQVLRRPLDFTVILFGVHYVVEALQYTDLTVKIVKSALITVGVVLWTQALLNVVKAITARTRTDLDDEIVDRLRRPIAVSVIFIGLRIIAGNMNFDAYFMFIFHGIIVTVALVLWAQSLVIIGTALLQALGINHEKYQFIQPRTLPLFDIIIKTIVIAGAIYGIFLAWDIDVTAWLASAGIAGIAVGFAAKDTLANLFAGIFIVADTPFKVGDFINLDSGERGKVTDIGIRSTRILTRDDVEITIPNAELGNAKIVNESGGPYEMERVRVNIGVAYGSDIDKVREVLMEAAMNSKYIHKKIKPRVRFREFGDSSLNFQLLGWIEKPVLRGRTLDELNTTIYKRFNEEGIEIPFPQQDIWVKELPKA